MDHVEVHRLSKNRLWPSLPVTEYSDRFGTALCCPSLPVTEYSDRFGAALCCPSLPVTEYSDRFGTALCCPSTVSQPMNISLEWCTDGDGTDSIIITVKR
jgi:hypothetical protein